jgi:hypothetical protein
VNEPVLRTLIEVGLFIVSLLLGVVGFFLREKLTAVERRLERSEAALGTLNEERARTAVLLDQIAKTLAAIEGMRTEMAIRYMTREDFASMLGRFDLMDEKIGELRSDLAYARGAAAAGGSPA